MSLFDAAKATIQQQVMARTTEEAFVHMQEVTKAAGLTLLTKKWINAGARCRFRCENGYRFERHAYVLVNGSSGCAQCMQATTRQQFLDAPVERNLTCLEGDYHDRKIRQHFECVNGHRSDTEARKILERSVFPKCANARTAELNWFFNGRNSCTTLSLLEFN
ncbi:hypothetical protein [Burkholderia sp. ABCPW 11]|uniref:hypothetical protein n=1 Tax=Burkholderia sp. ABCPW 11 TaxID=1637859 RepID=UPI0012FE1C33|nr:hypothetical protein [Burkholderia sp. ABCPW 11]